MNTCAACGAALTIGDWPFCPHGQGHANVTGDEIPGGQWQENGFRHPQKFYSKRERDRALAARNLEIHVKHQPLPGTDKSPHTTDWSKGSIDPVTLENARILATRTGGGTAPSPEPDIPITWTVRTVHD